MIEPPPATRLRTTWASAARLAGSGPTSKTEAVPSPTAGTRSPVLGIALVTRGAAAVCPAAREGSKDAAPSPAARAVKSRRVRSFISVSLNRLRSDERRAAFLRPAERHGECQPAERHRNGAGGDRGKLEAEHLQAVEEPAVERVGAAE